MRDGLDGRPCCAPAVLKRMTSRQCDLGGSAQPCSEWMLLKRETQPAWGHLPLHLLTHEQRTMPTECLHLPDPAGHSGDDSEATVRGSRDDEVFLARLTLSSSQSVSWPPWMGCASKIRTQSPIPLSILPTLPETPLPTKPKGQITERECHGSLFTNCFYRFWVRSSQLVEAVLEQRWSPREHFFGVKLSGCHSPDWFLSTPSQFKYAPLQIFK